MMRSLRRHLLLVLLGALLAVTGALSIIVKAQNPELVTTGANVTSSAESTALYCTGLSGPTGQAPGEVLFLNTSGSSRSISVQVVADTGGQASVTLNLAGYASQAVTPSSLVKGDSYAVAAQVNGGGVVGEEILNTRSAEAPCTSTGVSDWYGSGFDTLVGSSASLSIYNPTATPAVLNVVTYSSAGFNAPAPFQGLSVGAHAQVLLNLGSQIVNTANIGVHVRVLRGSIDVVGVERSGNVTSLDPGTTTTATSDWFPAVTTANNAEAQIRVANPGSQSANVTININLSPYSVSPQTLSVAPYASDVVTITPNPAIPAAGYANVTLQSDQPVIASLVTGTKSSGLSLSPAYAPSSAFLVADFAGRGFDAATVTNTSSHSISVTYRLLAPSNANPPHGVVQLSAGSSAAMTSLFSLSSLRATTLLVSSSRPSLVIATTLPSTPAGVDVVSPLYGG